MAKGQGFANAFTPYIRSTSDMITNYILRNADDEKKRVEEEKKAKEKLNAERKKQSGYQDVFMKLLGEEQPQKNPPAKDPSVVDITGQPMNPVQQAVLYSQLPENYRSAYNKYKELTKPVEPKEPKKLFQTEGYNKSNEKEILIKYEDGSEKRIPTGFFKEKKSDGSGGGQKFDADKFNKTLNGFSDELVKINKMKEDYSLTGSGTTKSNVNILNNSNEGVLYSIIEQDNEMKEALDSHYTELKEAFGDNYRNYEQSKQDDIKNKFIETMKQKTIDGDLSIEKFRALTLWAQFKYGYSY